MKCAICGNEITHPMIKDYFGNNPFPIRTGEDARCCDECNERFVVPIRIYQAYKHPKDVAEEADMLNEMSFKELKEIFNYED